jgi:DNA primase
VKLSAELVATVKDVSQIERVASEYVALRPSGHQLVGRCPFHDDHNPSFYIHPEKQTFFCHGCGVGGDVFTFVKMLKSCSFPVAVQFLAGHAGLSVAGFQPTPELTQKVKALRAQREAIAILIQFQNQHRDAVNQRYRALSRSATHAEKCLQAGERDLHLQDLAWEALKGFRDFEASIEREQMSATTT